MTFEEKVERARKMRSRETYGLVTQEELNQFPAVQEEIWPQTEAGPVHVYRITPEVLEPNCPHHRKLPRRRVYQGAAEQGPAVLQPFGADVPVSGLGCGLLPRAGSGIPHCRQ